MLIILLGDKIFVDEEIICRWGNVQMDKCMMLDVVMYDVGETSSRR